MSIANKSTGREVSTRQRFRPLRLALGAALAGYLCGFGYFVASISRAPQPDETKTDAAIVLTGGAGRVAAGIELLRQGYAGHMFISGVGPGAESAELARQNDQAGQSARLFACCVTIGHRAANTIGNAAESAEWMKERGYSSLRLVTSDYHLPRALLEFRKAMPGITIVPSPVRSAPRARMLPHLLTEYSKYLVALVRFDFAPFGKPTTP